MKRIFGIACVAIAVLAQESHQPTESTTPPAQAERAQYDWLFAEASSLGQIMYELAAERHTDNADRGEMWIMTVHRGTTIRKYSDGRFTVVSLPIVHPDVRIGLCRYAAQYNALNVVDADRLVMNGRYEDARRIYNLVLHFDRCGDSILKEQTGKKLELLKRLEATGADESLKGEFARLCYDLAWISTEGK